MTSYEPFDRFVAIFLLLLATCNACIALLMLLMIRVVERHVDVTETVYDELRWWRNVVVALLMSAMILVVISLTVFVLSYQRI